MTTAWSAVATPHSFNDVDSFRMLISHGGGDIGTYKGLSWYRKHFKLPAALAGNRVFLEFEGMRQAGDIYLNGKDVGLYENGVTAYGIDITDALLPNGRENVLAVKVDNTTTYKERAFCVANPKNADGSPCVGTSYQWSGNNFNPNHGGINRHVWLHVTGKIHQTLPLYYGLESQGVYVHAGNFNIAGKTADVTVDCRGAQHIGRTRNGRPLGGHRRQQRSRLRPVRWRSAGHGGRREERDLRHRCL